MPLPTALVRPFAALLGLACLPSLQAGESPRPETALIATASPPQEPFPHLGRLYHSETNPILNELWILGRYHGQNHWSDGSGGNDEGWEHRRLRLGGQIRLFKNLTLHAQAVAGADLELLYNGFTELWISWRFSEAISLTLGQQKHRFTHDRNVSSRYLNYLERSLLTNMFAADYTPAITVSGGVGRFSYYAGVFSNATGRDMGRAFTEYNSGYSFLASGTFDLEHSPDLDGAFLNLSYVRSHATENATNLNTFDHGLAAALILTKGPVSLLTEITAGLGAVNGNAVGINFQPGIFLTDKLQLVARYQLAASNEENGLRAQRRYEREVGLTTGDLYQAGYVGLNYYIAGHRLKLMSGIEYAHLGNEESWTGSVAVRFFFGPHARSPFPTDGTLAGLLR